MDAEAYIWSRPEGLVRGINGDTIAGGEPYAPSCIFFARNGTHHLAIDILRLLIDVYAVKARLITGDFGAITIILIDLDFARDLDVQGIA